MKLSEIKLVLQSGFCYANRTIQGTFPHDIVLSLLVGLAMIFDVLHYDGSKTTVDIECWY